MIDWSEIPVFARWDGLSRPEIALRLGISRVTVIWALSAERPPEYERAAAPTGFDLFEARVVPLLRAHPSIPVAVIMERVSFLGSITNLRRHVRLLRPLLAPLDPREFNQP